MLCNCWGVSPNQPALKSLRFKSTSKYLKSKCFFTFSCVCLCTLRVFFFFLEKPKPVLILTIVQFNGCTILLHQIQVLWFSEDVFVCLLPHMLFYFFSKCCIGKRLGGSNAGMYTYIYWFTNQLTKVIVTCTKWIIKVSKSL